QHQRSVLVLRVLYWYDTGTATVQRAPRHCCCSRSAVCSYPLSLSLAALLDSLLSSGLGPGILDTGLDCAATGWAGLGLALATLHDWTPWPVRTSRVPPHSFSRCSKDTLSVSSLLPILLLLLHPRCRPLTNLLPQEPDQSRDARRLQLLPPGLVILPCPPFISHGRFFLPPSSHSLVDQPASHLFLDQQSSRLPPDRVRIFTTQARNIRRPSVSSHRPRRASALKSIPKSRRFKCPDAACRLSKTRLRHRFRSGV
ncbi:hypothetical protein N5P37_003832, partial [Trichoderma harzianum]